MRDRVDLRRTDYLARSLDGRGYGFYKRLLDIVFEYDGVIARFTRVQGDPYAPPSWFEAVLPGDFHGMETGGFPWKHTLPLTDYLYRKLYQAARRYSGKCGTGNGCFIGVPAPAPVVIPRSGVEINGGRVVLRIQVGLPAYGRRINGSLLRDLLSRRLRGLIEEFRGFNRHISSVERHITTWLDYMHIRRYIVENNYVSFIADGSILPRESSLSHKPMPNAVPFKAPMDHSHVFDLPSGRRVRGLLITDKLTIITGGGYHGKSTLLASIQEGVYPHIPGDGRELVATHPGTIMVFAEDGRLVNCVDIYGLIRNLPSQSDTHCFTTMNASGSTSMAAGISEALEMGATTLLVDEDTSATNLLFKDRVMAGLLSYDPIKTMAQVIRSFMEKTGVNMVLINSASSAFLAKTDKVILMKNYLPQSIAIDQDRIEQLYTGIEEEYTPPTGRIYMGVHGLEKTKIHGFKIVFKYVRGGGFELEASRNPRVVEEGQARYIASVIKWLNRRIDGGLRVSGIIGIIDQAFKREGFKAFTDKVPPTHSWIMGMDVVWVINRLYNTAFKKA